MTIAADTNMFPLIQIQRAVGDQSSNVLEVAGSVNFEWAGLQGRENPQLWQWTSCCNELLRNAGFILQEPIRAGDFKKNVATLLSLYLIWNALPPGQSSLDYILFTEKWKKTEFQRINITA